MNRLSRELIRNLNGIIIVLYGAMWPSRKYKIIKVVALTYSIIMLGVWVLLAQNPYATNSHDTQGMYQASSHHNTNHSGAHNKRHSKISETGHTEYTEPGNR